MRSTHNVALKDTNWKIWLAGGPQYENEATHEGHTLDDLVDIPNTINETSGFVADIRQVTNVATDTGASNENGFCDVNYLYTQDIFGNEVPAKEDLVDVMEIDLSNYVNISMYDALTIVNYLEELISKLSTITVICAIVGVGAHSITVGVYRKQKDRKLKNKNQRNFLIFFNNYKLCNLFKVAKNSSSLA